jgi:hypothetical protein
MVGAGEGEVAVSKELYVLLGEGGGDRCLMLLYVSTFWGS